MEVETERTVEYPGSSAFNTNWKKALMIAHACRMPTSTSQVSSSYKTNQMTPDPVFFDVETAADWDEVADKQTSYYVCVIVSSAPIIPAAESSSALINFVSSEQ
jgi:hypothetical protein